MSIEHQRLNSLIEYAKQTAKLKTKPTQSTNIRNNRLIKEQLDKSVAVDILALPDNGLMHYGQFHMNLAAALEDDIINVIKPEWNGGRKESIISEKSEPIQESSDEIMSNDEPTVGSFLLELQPTYYKSGFFNVKVSDENLIGNDGERIDIYTGDSSVPIAGSINRRCNTNLTPRIMGGTGLRNWFVKFSNVGDQLTVMVNSPNSIRIRGKTETNAVA